MSVFPHILLPHKEDRAKLFSVVPSARRRGNVHKLKQWGFPLTYKLRSDGNGALAQVARRGCGASIAGDIQKQPGHGPGVPA